MHRLNDSMFKSIVTPDVIKLRDIFQKYGYEIRIVGGAVRDGLMSKQPTDLDFATSASVPQMKVMLAKENKRMVNLKGEEHGTVTANIYQQNFEISTINVRIPGRPIKEDWICDAKRRDLTINSMFLDFDRNIHDHLGGHDDLKKGEVRFIESADRAIEDRPFRIIRYFRFHSQFAKHPGHHEDGVLQAIKRYAAGLKRVPGERIWKELKIILQEKSRSVVIKTMMDVGIGPYIGMPDPNVVEFQNVSDKNKDTNLQPASFIAALLNDKPDVHRLQSRFKYSTDEMQLIYYIVENRDNSSDDSLLPYLQFIYGQSKLSEDIARKYVTELLRYKGAKNQIKKLRGIFRIINKRKFPINIEMFKIAGVPKVKKNKQKYKFVVEELIDYWYQNDYDLSAQQLLEVVPEILQEYKSMK